MINEIEYRIDCSNLYSLPIPVRSYMSRRLMALANDSRVNSIKEMAVGDMQMRVSSFMVEKCRHNGGRVHPYTYFTHYAWHYASISDYNFSRVRISVH